MAVKPRKPARAARRKSAGSKKAGSKKKAAAKKKTAGKKAATGKTAPKRTAGKTAAGRTTAGKKTAAKKTAGKKTTGKAPARKAAAKTKAPGKRAPAKKLPGRKGPAPKTPPARRSPPKKAAARRSSPARTEPARGKRTAAKKAPAGKKTALRKAAPKPAPKAAAPQAGRASTPHRLPGQRPAPRPASARTAANGRLSGRPATRPSPIEPKHKTTLHPHPAPAKSAPRSRQPVLAGSKPKRTPAFDLVSDLIEKARAAGADAADALIVESASISLAQRLGKPDKLERAESADLGLRVLVGKRQAVVSSTDVSPKALDELVERAVAMAKSVPEDPYCGLADRSEIARGVPKLDVVDPAEPSTDTIKERARAAEEAALAIGGVTNSEGAEAGWSRSSVTLVASNGFAGAYAVSRHSVAVSVIAGEGTAMESDYDFASAVYGADLESPEEVGRRAGERAVRRLKARKAATARVPVIYDPRVANSLVSHLAGAISGTAIARGTSFLKDKLGERILPQGVMVVDDPHRRRGLRSKPFDGEGLPNRPRNIVEDGVLTSWILDLRSARQLGLKSTGHASRGTSSPPSPSPTNLYLTPGEMSPEELISGVPSGFYVTHLMGFGINGTTGDYSRGAAGFWIEKGELAYPVSEVTVAGNLLDMYLNLTPANDLEFRYGTDAPTLRVDGMTVAGM